MIETEEVPRTYAEAVLTLVRWHGDEGPADLRVYSFPDPSEKFVRLVEVSGEFMPTGVIRPLTLRASDMFPFKSSVALATPDEWAAVDAGRMALPPDWNLAEKQQVWP